MQRANTDLSVTLSGPLYEHLVAEALRLDVPLEWLVASLVVDTVGDEALTTTVD